MYLERKGFKVGIEAHIMPRDISTQLVIESLCRTPEIRRLVCISAAIEGGGYVHVGSGDLKTSVIMANRAILAMHALSSRNPINTHIHSQ